MSTEPTHPRGATQDADLVTYSECRRLLERLGDRLELAMLEDVTIMRWLHKRLVSIERAAQERGVAR
jgi:hypothetical protein